MRLIVLFRLICVIKHSSCEERSRSEQREHAIALELLNSEKRQLLATIAKYEALGDEAKNHTTRLQSELQERTVQLASKVSL
jgi:hypothetical protein